MPGLQGETLAERLRKGPLSLEQFLKTAIEICERLEKAHRGGVVHRESEARQYHADNTGRPADHEQ
jgi:serine/threonine protein kinase